MGQKWYEDLLSEEDAIRVLFEYMMEKDSGLDRKHVYNAFGYLFNKQRMADEIARLWEKTEEDVL
jgi:hypothetical protein